MDSPIQPTPISSFPPSQQSITPRKLPIKRKNQTPQTPPNYNHPRIWSEQDEIQFLQNLLLQPSSESQSPLSHPFTKSQLSDKLRRLRKKFRNISSKIHNGDHSLVSPHDRKLYALMKRLWEPQTEPTFYKPSFNECNESNDDRQEANLVAVLALPSVFPKASNVSGRNEVKVNYNKVRVKVNDDEVKVKVKVREGDDSEVVKCGMKALGEVVDESLKMIRSRMMSESDVGRFSGGEKEVRFEKRWREQRMEEFEVLAKRVKLIMEDSSSVCGK